MLRTLMNLHCCDAYLRSAEVRTKRRIGGSIPLGHPHTCVQPRVLVVEFRDEVYAGLKSLLVDYGFEVERAECGSTVARCLRRFVPDLVLINEDMPDESGWLITCKLRLTRHRQPVWLYTVRQPRMKADWKEFSGVDEVIEYGGVLARLVQQVGQRMSARLFGPNDDPSHQPSIGIAALLVA